MKKRKKINCRNSAKGFSVSAINTQRSRRQRWSLSVNKLEQLSFYSCGFLACLAPQVTAVGSYPGNQNNPARGGGQGRLKKKKESSKLITFNIFLFFKLDNQVPSSFVYLLRQLHSSHFMTPQLYPHKAALRRAAL